MSKATKELTALIERVEQDERTQKEINGRLVNQAIDHRISLELFEQKLLESYSKIKQLEYENNVLVNTNSLVEADLAIYRSTFDAVVDERDRAIYVLDALAAWALEQRAELRKNA